MKAKSNSKELSIKDKLLKELQKFLNQPFKYNELLKFIDKQRDFLLKENHVV